MDPYLILIVCQKSKVNDWLEHFETYYPGYVRWNLTNKKEFEDFKLMCMEGFKHVAVINYELTFRRPDLLRLHGFTLMLDESCMISNELAKRTKFILKMKPYNVILLSGTPVAGKYEKLWSQCRLLGWNISKHDFWNRYVITTFIDVGGFLKEIPIGKYRHVDEMKNKLKEHGAIFMKTDEVMSLPDQIEQLIKCEPSVEYKRFHKKSYVEIDGKELVGDNSLTKRLYERQLCGQYSKDKLKAFEDLLDSTEDRLIVFYNFTDEWLKLEAICKKHDRPTGAVNGKVRNLSAFEEADNSVTFVQYQAGAMGLNLQKANRIVYFTLPLGRGSCDLWEQSKKRIHRIGQEKTCFYYYLMVKDSIEEQNLESLKRGKDLIDDLFEKGK